MADLPPSYDCTQTEPEILARWEQARVFHADANDGKDPYAIVIPPPNVTAALHLGHALNNTLQDILARRARMQGKSTCWMPGTDHAGIATQTIVDKRLQAEGKPALKDYKKLELEGQDGRGQFLDKVNAWKDEYEAKITNQLKTMGCSCDWERQRFTMDPMCAKAVREAFFRLFKDGLIYRGKRLVNWDPVSQTALADDEVEMETIDGSFTYLKYPVVSKKNPDREGGDLDGWVETGEFVTVATTRPETMLGDTAVAVNPKDPVNGPMAGKHVRLPIVGRVIPIIADEYVVIPDANSADAKAKMSSGFLKVTPAHDPNDYALGQKYALAMINVMAADASISLEHGWAALEPTQKDNAELKPFLGQSRENARKAVVRWFKEKNLLDTRYGKDGIAPYRHAVGHSYRSHVPVEPYLSDQWYVKVTDDKLAGAALRAMDESQREAGTTCTWTETHPFGQETGIKSRDREGAGTGPASTEGGPLRPYLITFTTFGARLPGDERTTVEHGCNTPGTPRISAIPGREGAARLSMGQEGVVLTHAQRQAVRDAIVEVCAHRGWKLRACNVRSNHLHVVAWVSDADRAMNDFKSYATRRLKEAGMPTDGEKTWTRHGSTRHLHSQTSRAAACNYVMECQGDDEIAKASWRDARKESVFEGEENIGDAEGEGCPLPHGRGSLIPSSSGLKFYPARYAKNFQQWHENIRDWCISRQLWWGHRVPVWSATHYSISWHDFSARCSSYAHEDRVSWKDSGGTYKKDGNDMYWPGPDQPENDASLAGLNETNMPTFVCVRDESDREVIEWLESLGFTQDPDVLDTWFSSALWPLSTFGWPENTPELQKWNPTDVLCTAREIITLWVSRMVMFNLYFRGTLPFRDVFIHAMIQDGHGQKMSKSLGNGVDPMDIIHSHGSDAMRFALAKMTTHTQDLRLPVDMVDPHTGESFTPAFTTIKGGFKVAAAIQERNGKQIVSSYGAASGEAKPSAEAPLARNTSEKFDEGKRFANKMWNAFRFALSNLEGKQVEGEFKPDLADQWILGRLQATIEAADKALGEYMFANYASALLEFFWNDLCDWYIEATKPTIQTSATRQRVLATCLDASLRLLHPAMPFITERLWERLNEVVPAAKRGVPGLVLPEAKLLVTAQWPALSGTLGEAAAVAQFEQLRTLVGALREMRTAAKLPPREKKDASIKAPAAQAAFFSAHKALIETFTATHLVATAPDAAKAKDAAAAIVSGCEVYLHGVLDAEVEKKRLAKAKAELEGKIKNFQTRLANEKYVATAPPKLVQETRDGLAAAQAELAAVEAQMAAL